MALVRFIELTEAQAAERFSRWSMDLEERAGAFAAALPPVLQEQVTESGWQVRGEVMRWCRDQGEWARSVPGDVALPPWLVPGSEFPDSDVALDPTPGWAWLLDGFCAWKAAALLHSWPGSVLFMARSRRRGRRDLAHNSWQVGSPKSSVNVNVLDAAYALITSRVNERDVVRLIVQSEALIVAAGLPGPGADRE